MYAPLVLGAVAAADGFRVDYGHDGLLAGIASPGEVFPLVRDWLAAHD